MTGSVSIARGDFLDDPDTLILTVLGDLELALDQADVAAAVAQVAPSRAQRRRLANALVEDPSLLTSGRPHGPPQIEQLIRALVLLGASQLTIPLCGHCHQPRPLRQLDGDLRICNTCDRKRHAKSAPCVTCGSTRQVASRDRNGQPLCPRCISFQKHDPVPEICAKILLLDSDQDQLRLQEIVCTAVPQQFQRHKVLWELESRPQLLAGQGAHGSPAINVLIRALIDAGVRSVIAPACPSCERVVPLKFRRNGQRCCRRCYDQVRATPCARCGTSTMVASRTAGGEPVCGLCFRRDPANHGPCAGCGRVALVHRHGDGPARCRACFRAPLATCSLCGQHKPCHFAESDRPRCEHCSRLLRRIPCSRCSQTLPVWTRTADGQPLCNVCSTRREPCSGCGQTRKVKGRTPDGPLCGTCYSKNPISFHPCIQCGSTERLHHHGLCQRCAARQQLLALLSHSGGDMHAHLEPIFQLLTTSEPRAILSWLRTSTGKAVLAEASHSEQPLTHEALDLRPQDKATDYLRKVLTAGGILPARDEYVTQFERWTAKVIAQINDPQERRIVRSFAIWHALRRLRARSERRDLTMDQANYGRAEVRTAIALIAWLRSNDTTLADCTQHEIDRWLTDGPSTNHLARSFLNWTCSNGHTQNIKILSRAFDPSSSNQVEDDHRWALVRRLLHDEDLTIEDRFAGLLVLLFGQPLTRITRITRDKISTSEEGTRIRLGQNPVDLPAPLDSLALQLADKRRSRYLLGNTEEHPWLFPGAPGKPRSATHIATRLRKLGIPIRAGRNAALMDLAAKLPGVILSKLLGIHINTAVRWTDQAGVSGARYAAEVTRRSTTQPR